MTRGVDAKTMAAMRGAGVLYLLDTGKIGTYADGTADATGKPAQTWTYAETAITCSFKDATAYEIAQFGQVAKLVGTLFLPLGTVIAKRDRFHLLTRWSQTYDQYFEVIGNPIVGPIQLQMQVSLVTVTNKV